MEEGWLIFFFVIKITRHVITQNNILETSLTQYRKCFRDQNSDLQKIKNESV